jgi:hypothetical protein
VAVFGELEQQLHEGGGQLVLAPEVVVPLAVPGVEGLVLDGDVGRVGDDGVVLAAGQGGDELLLVFGGVGEVVLDRDEGVLVVAEPVQNRTREPGDVH